MAIIAHIVTRLDGGTGDNLRGAVEFEESAGVRSFVLAGQIGSRFGDVPGRVIEGLQREPAWNDFKVLRRLARELRTIRPDVVHTHQAKAGVVGRLVNGRFARIHTYHMRHWGEGFGAIGRVSLTTERLLARRTDLLVAVGASLANEVALRVVRSGGRVVHVCPSSARVEQFLDSGGSQDAIRRSVRANLGLRGDATIAFVVSALEPRKRVVEVVEALAEPLRNGLTIVVCGSGPESAALRRMAGRQLPGGLVLLGERDDIHELLPAADVLVHGSIAEGLPQVFVQSIAAGVPIVTVRVDGCDDLSTSAVRVVEDLAELGPAVEQVLSGPPLMVDRTVVSRWSYDRVRASHLSVLEEALTRRQVSR